MRVSLIMLLAVAALACDSGEPDFAILEPTETVVVELGQIGEIAVEIERYGGLDRTVVITASGLRAGITPGALSLAPGRTTGTLQLAVETSAEPGPVDDAMLIGVGGDLERAAPLSLVVAAP